jgi:hypothetical protein
MSLKDCEMDESVEELGCDDNWWMRSGRDKRWRGT